MEASCWVARKIFLSAARASSSARTLDSRPTTNGVIMKGKMTTSRMGIIGSFLVSNFSLDVVTASPLGDSCRDVACNVLPCSLSSPGVSPGLDPCRRRRRSKLRLYDRQFTILPRLVHQGERCGALLYHLPRHFKLF